MGMNISIAVDGTKLSDLKPKDEFKIGDEVFIVLEQTEGGTKVIAKEFIDCKIKFGNKSDWKKSNIRKKLNCEYLDKIATIIGKKNILSMERNLISLDGLNEYGVCEDKVSLLTIMEYSKYRYILGEHITYEDEWWLITPCSTPSNGYSQHIGVVFTDGVVGWGGSIYPRRIRPVIKLNSSILIIKTAN